MSDDQKIKDILEGKVLFEINKEEEFSTWYNTIVRVADIIDDRYPIKGMPVYKTYGYRLVKNILSLLELELEKKDILPAWFPVLIPESIFKRESEHIRGFEGEVFWITRGGLEELEEKYVLRPTSETEMYFMYSKWIRSYRDLPLKIYMTNTVYRYETKATKPLIRGREILWNEAHTAHRDKEDAENMIKESMEIYGKLFWDYGLVPYIWLKRPEWDKFAGADYTIAADTILPDGRVLQIGTTHLLGQNFARAYDIKYQDKDGEWKFVWQTSFGVSMRFAAAVISIHGDNKGLILPPKVAPIQIVIVPILTKNSKDTVLSKARELYKKLREKYRVYLDDDDTKTAGWKYYYWELKGVPLRIEIGPRDVENNTVVLARRDTREKITVSLEELERKIEEIFNKIEENLKERAKKWFESKIVEVRSYEELKKAISERKVAKAPFCSIDHDGEECYKRIKEDLGAEVRGVKFPEPEMAEGEKCIVCGRPAKYWVYIAKSY